MTGPSRYGAVSGFCPFCGTENTPSYQFCLACRRRLPAARAAPSEETRGRPSGEVVAHPSKPTPAVPPAAGGASARNGAAQDFPVGRPWFLIPVAIALAALVGLAGVELLPTYLHPQPAKSAGPTGIPTWLDLCTPSNGTNCGGHQLTLPWNYRGATLNVSSCDPVPSGGAGEILWLNYTGSARVHGVVVPAAVFGGRGGWFAVPSGFLNNTTAVASAVWNTAFAAGSFTEAISIPDSGQLWCLGWWEPAGSVTLSWSSDLATTYVSAK